MTTMEAAEVVAKLAELPSGRAIIDAAADARNVWLVGGAVRDCLLERELTEIDLVVEGPLEPLLARLGGEAEHFERFGTATVDLAGSRIDVASARSETYSQPGALPEISAAAITEDLQRRDFTINAIAVRISDPVIEAHESALNDLGAGTIRVLHDSSFVDDPTRLWRCARYSSRLGFTVDSQTRALAAQATPGAVSGERIGHELRLALREPDPTAVFASIEGLNVRALLEGFTARPPRLAQALELIGDAGNSELLTLAACSEAVDLDLLTRWLDFLQFSANDRDIVAVASRWVTAAPLRNAQTPAQIAAAAKGAPLEAVALGGGENARQWIDQLRFVKLEISGDDLIAEGIEAGPRVGSALQHALDLTLDARISGRDEQLAAALERARGGGE